MYAVLKSFGLKGLNGFPVEVEADISGGMPALSIVGLPDSAVRESGDRVHAALKNLGFKWPDRRITINLAPADVRKTGPVYDLPLLLAVGVCLAAGRVSLSGVSPGMCLAAALLIRSVRELEPVRAAAWGAAVGLCMGLLGDAPDPAPMAVLSLSCAALSRVRPAPVPVRIGTFCAVGAGCVLLLGMEEPLYRVIELASGGMLSLLPLPRLTPAAEKKEPQPEKRPLQDRFAKPAAALRDLYDSFFRGTAPEKPENPSVLFDRAAEQVCRRCILRDTCWRQNYGATYNAFNDACPQLLRRGQALPGDFPLYFTSRCVHLTEFVEAVNLELRSYLLRQQYHRRLSEVRDQAREQYAQLGDLLASAGPAVPASAQAMGYRVASSLRPREGQNVCGDQLDSFEVGGAVYLLLSDGMGSGEAAHREAAMTVRLLRQFLEAGIEPGPALKTLNTALSLRGESGGGFTTIDLLALQRSSGQAALYKYGAAPSYCKRGGSVSRYAGQSLPAGLQAVRDAPECTRLQLTAGSFFVMVSDGIADAGNDEWLQNLLAGWSGRDVNALVSLILAESRGRKGLEDDCAVLALHLSSGEKKAGLAGIFPLWAGILILSDEIATEEGITLGKRTFPPGHCGGFPGPAYI